jgi:TPR repeat protein
VPPEAPTAFFSYSRDDSEFALRLAQELKAAGANVWIDQLDIEPGQEWDSAIEAAVTQSPRMLLILSPASVKSRNVRNEISFALDESKTIIPVLHLDCTVPLQLRRVQYIDLRTDYSRGFAVLLRALGVELRTASRANTAMPEPHGAAMAPLAEPALPEQHELVPKNIPVVQQRRDNIVSRYPGRMTAVVALCSILIATSVLYWNSSHSRERHSGTGDQQIQLVPKQPASAESYDSPVSRQTASRESQGRLQTTEVGIGTAKPPSTESAPSGPRAVPQDGQARDGQTAKVAGGGAATNPARSGSLVVPAAGGLPADLDPKLGDLYRRAQQGDTFALDLIGDAYRYDKDYVKALVWYHKAAAAGSSSGMTSLGLMYEYGTGVDKDYKQAVSWYRKAADAGSDQSSRDGMYYLGVMYEKGNGVKQDQQQALVWYRKAADLGLRNADAALARLGDSRQPVSSGVSAAVTLPAGLDPKLADVYRQSYALGGDALGLKAVGSYYEFQRDYARALPWYRKAAQAGMTTGMTSLGRMLEMDGVDRDYKEAVNWYRKASDAGDRDGMYYLGVMYENGRGINQDRQQAIVLYRQAASRGLGDAEDALKRLGESSK